MSLTRRTFLKGLRRARPAWRCRRSWRRCRHSRQPGASGAAFPDPSPGHCAPLPDTCGPEDLMPAVYEFEAMIGRTLAVTRHYPNWDFPTPNDVIKESARTGHMPLIAWRPRRHMDLLGADREAQGARPHRDREEGEGDRRLEPARVLRLSPRAGERLPTRPGRYARGVPDGVQHDPPGLWKPFPDLFDSAHEYALSIGKSMVIEEWGSVRADVCAGTGSQTQADWIRQAADTVQTWSGPTGGVKAMIYTNSRGLQGRRGGLPDRAERRHGRRVQGGRSPSHLRLAAGD